MNEKEFIEQLKLLNININNQQLEKLEKYYNLLIEWNQKINLTAITEKKQVYLKHFYDSATIIKVIDLNKESTLCDVGTGAGFPGIVLKILFPNLEVTLMDSLNKRINFLNKIIDELKLTKIYTVHCRIEEYATKEREIYDVVTARAVAPLNTLLEYCIPLVKKDKFFIPMKGIISQEIDNSLKALKILNSKIVQIEEFELPEEAGKRTLLKIQKLNKTDKKFPRKNSEIIKKPL